MAWLSGFLDRFGRRTVTGMAARSRWQDGRRAWNRLNGWHNRDPHAVPGHPDDGESALKALEDVHLVRTLLDTAELNAAQTARKHGQTWSQIAVALHTTKQAAWEKWHDLSGETDVQAPAAQD